MKMFIKNLGFALSVFGIAVSVTAKPTVSHELTESEKTLGCIKPKTEQKFDYVECLNLKGFAIASNIVETPFGEMPYPMGLVDKTGKIILPNDYYKIAYPREWQYDSSYADTNKKLPDGLVIVVKRDFKNNPMFGKLGVSEVYGAVNEQGEFIVPLGKYDEIYEFYDNGLILVKKNDKYGYIDSNGNEVIPLIYDKAETFDGKYTVVAQNNHHLVINTNGQTVLNFDGYDYVSSLKGLNDNQYFAVEKNQKFALFDENKKQLTDFRYDLIRPIYFSDLLIVDENNKVGVIDNTGKQIIPTKYDYIENTLKSRDKNIIALKTGYIEANDGEQSFLFDIKGNLVK